MKLCIISEKDMDIQSQQHKIGHAKKKRFSFLKRFRECYHNQIIA